MADYADFLPIVGYSEKGKATASTIHRIGISRRAGQDVSNDQANLDFYRPANTPGSTFPRKGGN